MSYEDEELWMLEDWELDIELLKARMRVLDKIQRDIRRRLSILAPPKHVENDETQDHQNKPDQ